MKKALTIEGLKNRVGKPVFVIATTEEFKRQNGWHVVSRISGNKNHECIEFTDCHHFHIKNRQFFRFFDTEVSDMELKEILDAEEKAKKKTGYERTPKERYSAVSGKLQTVNYCDHVDNLDDEKYNIANYFNDIPLCENIARAERLKYQLRRFAALNGGIPSKEDWADCEIFKYYVACDYRKNEIYATYTSTQRDSFQIYFKDIKACKKAIEIFKDELIWYFTEFEEQLY